MNRNKICELMSSDIEYINVLKPLNKLEYSGNNKKIKIKEKLPFEALIISLLFLICWLGITLIEDIISVWNSIIGLGILLFIAYFIKKSLRRNVILIISKRGILIRNRLIKWESITEILCRIQDTGEYHIYELIISTSSTDKITIPLKWLDMSPKGIIKAIGDYYWTNMNKDSREK